LRKKDSSIRFAIYFLLLTLRGCCFTGRAWPVSIVCSIISVLPISVEDLEKESWNFNKRFFNIGPNLTSYTNIFLLSALNFTLSQIGYFYRP
jgi:hypothetical protein